MKNTLEVCLFMCGWEGGAAVFASLLKGSHLAPNKLERYKSSSSRSFLFKGTLQVLLRIENHFATKSSQNQDCVTKNKTGGKLS